ncbi:Mediator of RNA polymerase II transcription subunit 15 [Trinorchestia longiramus]|nr:Mediator of RNA polymerase II transcription subunit 15 [Trinorchestia longiramus]
MEATINSRVERRYLSAKNTLRRSGLKPPWCVGTVSSVSPKKTMGDENAWKTPEFRQKIISKFDEKIEEMTKAPERSSEELESRIFEKSTSKEEYLRFASRILISLKEQPQST